MTRSGICPAWTMKIRASSFLPVLLAALLLLSACSMDADNTYPSLVTTGETGSATQETTTQTTESQPVTNQITVALPLDAQALEAMRLLYLAKESDLLTQVAGQYIGLDVQLDDLKQFDQGDQSMSLELFQVSPTTGVTRDQVSIWRAADSLPDILYTKSVAGSLGIDQCYDLSQALYGNSLLQPGQIVVPALENCQTGGQLLALPYMLSTQAVYLNQTLLAQLGLELPSETWTWEDFINFSEAAGQAIEAQGLGAGSGLLVELAEDEQALTDQLNQAVFVLDEPTAFLEPLSLDLSTMSSWPFWTGSAFDFTQPACLLAVEWLSPLVLQGYTPLHLDASQIALVPSLTGIRSQGRVLMWLDDSTRLTDYKAAGLTIRTLPLPQQDSRLAMTAGVLAVAAASDSPDLAAQFAAFLALDADALLMLSRYQTFDGQVPMLTDAMVWQHLTFNQQDWQWLAESKGKMSTGLFSPQQVVGSWDDALWSANDLLASQWASENFGERLPDVLAQMTRISNQLLEEVTQP